MKDSLSAGRLLSTPDDGVFKNQQIHVGPQKAIERLLWSANDRLILVEGRVQYDRYAGRQMKAVNEQPEPLIGLAMDGLQSGGTVDSLRREAHPVLYTAKALLFRCRNNPTIAHDACSSICVKGINPEDQWH